jgi:2-hydroxy-palmitic acid dioxygenase Mpo1-like protein
MTSPFDTSPNIWQRRPLRRALHNWLDRHQHPVNFWIHLIGIPLALGGIVFFFVLPWEQWYWTLAALAGGYALQFIGHRVEGNDMGEWAGIKRLLGLPYVAIAPPVSRDAQRSAGEEVDVQAHQAAG